MDELQSPLVTCRPVGFDTYQNRFIGRVDLIAELRSALDRHRLVTVTGAPGTGKTRLAMRIADAERDVGRDVVFIDLSRAKNALNVSRQVLRAIGSGAPVGLAPEAIDERGDVLIVLDNFEHLMAHRFDTIDAWLRHTSAARFLVTSREQLRLAAEHAVEVQPLSLPPTTSVTAEQIADSDAGCLLIERAPGYTATDDDAPLLAEIVRTLDGIPLAIELAASRMQVLGPAQLRERLARRFEILSATPDVRDQRQATLEGAIEWSWSLLEPWEQSALAQCSVFRGGFLLDAAETVVDVSAHPEAPPLLDVLQRLQQKSLLRTYRVEVPSGAMRFAMYESIREFAADEPSHPTARAGATSRHAAYFGDKTSDMAIPGFRSKVLLELDNFFAAFENVLDHPAKVRDGARRAHAVTYAIDAQVTGRCTIGVMHALRDAAIALNAPNIDEVNLPMLVLRFEAGVYAAMNRPERAQSCFERALQAAVDDHARAQVLYSWGAMQPNPSAARSLERLDEALRLAKRVDDDDLRRHVQVHLGNHHLFRGRAAEALRHFQQALADGGLGPEARCNLAMCLHELGRFDDARAQLNLAITELGDYEEHGSEGGAFTMLAMIDHEQGRPEDAREHYQHAIELLDRHGSRRMMADARAGFAHLLADLGAVPEAQGEIETAELRCKDVGDADLWESVRLRALAIVLAEARLSPDPDRAAELRTRVAEAIAELADPRSDEPAATATARASEQQPVFSATLRLLGAGLEAAAFRVAPDASWFAPPAASRVDLSRRHVLRRLLGALVEHRQSNDAEPLSVDALIAKGWPGERIDRSAAVNRVHVSLTTLRKLGLRHILCRDEAGYHLDRSIQLRLTPNA